MPSGRQEDILKEIRVKKVERGGARDGAQPLKALTILVDRISIKLERARKKVHNEKIKRTI